MHKVQRMTQTPTQCLYCFRGNIPNDPDTLDDFWAIDLERDVNWGDSTYLCKYCVDKIAILGGFVTMDQLEEQLEIQKMLRKRMHDLEAKLQARDRRLEQIVTGAKAVRRTKKESVKAQPKSNRGA